MHRLTQTKELVPVSAQKQFMRLQILMSTQKGHFAYRLAWANTTSGRIPFLPLHRRDLLLAEEANQTHPAGVNSRINWAKFDVMGDVILGIQRSQFTSYPTFSRNEEIQRLILEGSFSKDDDVSFLPRMAINEKCFCLYMSLPTSLTRYKCDSHECY